MSNINGRSNDLKQKSKTGLEKAKDKIFFERQEGRLCGQHCLNNALQSNLFDAVDLSAIAQQLDEDERRTMAEHGTDTKEYLEFISKPSSNYDDSGYFSVQVLSQALKNVNLELVNWKSDDERAVLARENPLDQNLFICHMDDHWLAIRRLGKQWVDLNSNLKNPELLSDTYLSIYLRTMQAEGYIIFFVCGELPECEAENLFRLLRRGEDGKYIDEVVGDVGHRLGSSIPATNDDELMQRDLELSMASSPAEAIRKQREQFLLRFNAPSPPSASDKEATGDSNGNDS